MVSVSVASRSISALTGTAGLIKNGTGNWTLNGTSNFSGGTFQVLLGTLTLSGGGVYNGVNTPVLSQAGTLVLDNTAANLDRVGENLRGGNCRRVAFGLGLGVATESSVVSRHA